MANLIYLKICPIGIILPWLQQRVNQVTNVLIFTYFGIVSERVKCFLLRVIVFKKLFSKQASFIFVVFDRIIIYYYTILLLDYKEFIRNDCYKPGAIQFKSKYFFCLTLRLWTPSYQVFSRKRRTLTNFSQTLEILENIKIIYSIAMSWK